MSPESLPIKLRQARGAMTLAQAAEQSEIPEERIRMYEEGVRRPYGKTLRRLADVYGVRVAELMGAGQVARVRSRTPEVRRRRRRITAPAENGVPIALPLEVSEGQTVRLVIELVVRHRGGEAIEDEPLREKAPAATSAREEPPTPAQPRSLQAPASMVAGPRPVDVLRRPRSLDEASQPLDPIVELKRAYRDFRHKKQ